MPGILSKDLAGKILGREWSFGYNCYEVGHTWTPSCTGAALEVSSAAAIKIMPLYGLLYAFSQLAVQQRFDLDSSWDTAKSTLRSTFFIFFHAYNGAILGCALRNGFGRFYYRVLVCAPALLSSYVSLLIEKPSRRQALAFYLLNMASEIVYRMAVTKGYFTPVKHGETLLFALSLGAWYHLLKRHGFGHDPVSAAVKVLIGRDEAKSRSRRRRSRALEAPAGAHGERAPEFKSLESELELELERDASKGMQDAALRSDREEEISTGELAPGGGQTRARARQLTLVDQLEAYSNYLSELLDRLGEELFDGRHASCPHERQRSCLRYVIGPIASRFLVGHTIQSLLRLSSQPYALLMAPRKTFLEAFTSSASARFGLFLASLVASGRLTSCLLRRFSNSNEPAWHALVSGCVAGSSMLWSPKASLSMYVMWKAVEQYYLLAASQKRVRYFNFTISTIYSISAATILYTFALEPRFVRPSYMRFLDRLSDHRLHQLNRMVLDVFGTGSSVGYEDYFPDLDPKFMSNQFKELIFNWMIQPYE